MEPYQWCLVVLLSVVAIVGIPGNILVILIYQQKARRLSMNVYISGLAAVDLFVCALSSYRLYFWIEEDDFHNELVCHLFTWLGFWSEMLTAFLTTAIALDRYLSVCRPHSVIITPVRALVSILISTVVSGLLSLFSFAIYNIDEQTSHCKITESGPLLYIFAALTFSAYALLMLLALIFYWLVFREVRKRTKVQPRLIEVHPRNENTSSLRTEPTVQRSRSVPCSPTRGAAGGGNRWKQAQQLMISRQLEHRLTLVSLAAFTNGSSRERPRINVETVSIRQSSLLTTNISHLPLPRNGGTASRRDNEQAGRSRSGSSCFDNHIESQFDAATAVTFNEFGKNHSRAGSFIKRTLSHIDLKSAGADANKADGNNQPALRRRRTRTGKMLLLATIVFVVTWTARCIMWLVEFAQEEWWGKVRGSNSAAFATLILLQHIYYTTPAVNPVIYSYVNPRFREDCEKIIKKFKCRCKDDL